MNHLTAVMLAAGTILLAACCPGKAQTAGYPGTQIDRTCNDDGCRTTIGPREWPSAKIIQIRPPANAREHTELDARIEEWERTCEPVIVRDRYGVRRYSYGPACPNGVIVGDGKRP